MSIHFWIFSFNRGQFLENCVSSIETCAPGCVITVFDDDSDDAETLAILDQIAQQHRVMKPQSGGEGSKHGGLYRNMQAAYESANDNELTCFLQDDTQLVRPLGEPDFQSLQRFFTQNPKAGFVQPAFFRGRNEKSDASLTRYDEVSHVYYVDRFRRSAGAFYSDICLFMPERLRAVDWQFVVREAGNEQQARQHFEQLAYWGDPFAAWLPNGPAYRGKSQNWALRRAHIVNESGFYPIDILEGESLGLMMQRQPSNIPYAEKFLRAPGNTIFPWIYYPLQNRKWLKKLSILQGKLVAFFCST